MKRHTSARFLTAYNGVQRRTARSDPLSKEKNIFISLSFVTVLVYNQWVVTVPINEARAIALDNLFAASTMARHSALGESLKPVWILKCHLDGNGH